MKLMIDIPDNELKVPLKNIHLLISDGIIGEVCIKKYDKDKPYFMNLNYALLEEGDDCVSLNAVIDVFDTWWVNNHESDNAIETLEDKLNALPTVKPIEKVGKWISIGDFECYCSNCHYWCYKRNKTRYCPSCGWNMQEIKE